MHARSEAHRLASLRGLPLAAINSALATGVLSFGTHRGQPAWFVRDEYAGCARRLDGRNWTHRSTHAKADDTPGNSGANESGWPIGILQAKECATIIVCEGCPDALAAHAVRVTLCGTFAIVCLLGSGLTIVENALSYFRGKRVRIIAHADSDGLAFAERNARVLADIAEQVSIATLDGLSTANGTPASDLCDVLAFRKPWCVPNEIAELFDFATASARVRIIPAQTPLFPAPVPFSALVTQENPTSTHREQRRTQKMGREEIGGEEALHEKAIELASTARGQSYRKLFLIAQAVCGHFGHRHCKAESLSTAVFDSWFAASRAHLDPTETRAHYLPRFRAAFRKVRVIAKCRDSLAKAEERALSVSLPEIPDAPDAPHGWQLLAAVCRELQRAAGHLPFFIGMRDAARIATGQAHPQTGGRILEAFAELGLIQCVKKGTAKLGGDASEYRYLLP